MRVQKTFLAGLLCLLLASVASAADWGSVSGQLVLQGAVPEPVLLHKKNAPIKDAATCAAKDTFNEGLIVDPDSKGIANIVVYPYRYKGDIHPDLAEPKEQVVVFDQKGCMFTPRMMLGRVGQTVHVLSGDPVAHNTRTSPLKGAAQNFVVSPNERTGIASVSLEVGESMPYEVKCDFHSWMTAYWLVLDHPYAAKTDKDGHFKIENMPAGDYKFRIWHERCGWIKEGSQRDWKITIKGGEEVKLGKLETVRDVSDPMNELWTATR